MEGCTGSEEPEAAGSEGGGSSSSEQGSDSDSGSESDEDRSRKVSQSGSPGSKCLLCLGTHVFVYTNSNSRGWKRCLAAGARAHLACGQHVDVWTGLSSVNAPQTFHRSTLHPRRHVGAFLPCSASGHPPRRAASTRSAAKAERTASAARRPSAPVKTKTRTKRSASAREGLHRMRMQTRLATNSHTQRCDTPPAHLQQPAAVRCAASGSWQAGWPHRSPTMVHCLICSRHSSAVCCCSHVQRLA